jgi:hypothetical protein
MATYEDGRGRQTYIDVTLAKGGVDATWKIKREWNLGCHKCILLHLGLQGDVRSRGRSGGVRLSTTGANWDEYRSILREELDKVETWDSVSKVGVVTMVRTVQRLIMRAACVSAY